MRNQVQLITYVDRLGENGFAGLRRLLRGPLAGLFGGAHLLPFYTPYDGADAGFDPDDHLSVDPRLGDWSDVRAIADDVDVVADLIVNHISARSAAFRDVLDRGDASPFAGLFLTFAKVFPDGASEAALARLERPHPGLPFTLHGHSGARRLYWTTFSTQQIDIDVEAPQGQAYLSAALRTLQGAGVRMVRLDAAGYAVKRPGTSCFLIPETLDFITATMRAAAALGMETLVELHGSPAQQTALAATGAWIYDFALAPLTLHALFTGDAGPLARWIAMRPRKSITVLDTHDGIGIGDAGPDREGRPGLLTPDDAAALAATIGRRSHGESGRASGAAAQNLDDAQVNCAFFDALGRRDHEMLIARALQFFLPGIPQVYYVGLLGGGNDMARLARTGVGRDINRRSYDADAVANALRAPLPRRLVELISLRNTHPAFAGRFDFEQRAGNVLTLNWSNGQHFARLDIDFPHARAELRHSEGLAERRLVFAPAAAGDQEKNAASSGRTAAPMAAGSELLSDSTSSGCGGATP